MSKLIDAIRIFWKVLNGYGVVYNINLHQDRLIISGSVWLDQIYIANSTGTTITIYPTKKML